MDPKRTAAMVSTRPGAGIRVNQNRSIWTSGVASIAAARSPPRGSHDSIPLTLQF
jgi:hypothetical protein